MSAYLAREGKRFVKCKTNISFLNAISNKYKNNISVAQYMLERFKYNNIDKIFVSNNKNSTSLIKPIKRAVSDINNLEIVFNNYEINTFYSALTYSDAFNKVGVCINTTKSNFDEFQDLLCVSKPLLSICIYNKISDLRDVIKNTETINPCFIDAHTMHYPHNFPQILEYLLNICLIPSTAPVHLNMSRKFCYKNIDLSNIQKNKSILSNNIPIATRYSDIPLL